MTMNQNSNASRDPYLETRDAAQHYRYSVSQFRALVRAGKVPAPVRIHGKLLWRQSLLDAHMRSLEIEQGVIPPNAA
jgi:predicted DNA-binding transcriptional regulator AlpA